MKDTSQILNTKPNISISPNNINNNLNMNKFDMSYPNNIYEANSPQSQGLTGIIPNYSNISSLSYNQAYPYSNNNFNASYQGN